MVFRLFAGEPPDVHEVLNIGVVGGDLVENAIAQNVGARVADMDHAELRSGAEHGNTGGPEAFQVRIGIGTIHQFAVSRFDGVAKLFDEVVSARSVVVKRSEVRDRYGRGNVTARGAAHAVGENQ